MVATEPTGRSVRALVAQFGGATETKGPAPAPSTLKVPKLNERSQLQQTPSVRLSGSPCFNLRFLMLMSSLLCPQLLPVAQIRRRGYSQS